MFGSRDRLLKARLREPFVVTMLDGSAWQGVLYAVDDRTVVLRDTQPIGAESPRGVVDGELILARAQIAFMQRP